MNNRNRHPSPEDDQPAPTSAALGDPRIWVLASYRAGENRQITGLADNLGLPWEHRRLHYRPRASGFGLLRQVSADGIDRAASDPLQAPWPDLVISAGLRNEPVARWIRERSGGRTRLVFIGRTWLPPDHLDLLVTTPQYRIPEHPRVLHNLLTLHDLTPEFLARARERWMPHFAPLPRPWIGVLLGGPSGPFALGVNAAARLAAALDDLRAGRGGTILGTGSPRTPTAALDVLESGIRKPALLHRWRPDDPDNPYLGILACADELVITGDSVSMLSEAAATGAPVRIFPLPDRGSTDTRPRTLLYRLLMRWGPTRASRDVGLFHRAYVGAGLGTLLDGRADADTVGAGTGPQIARREMQRTVEAVRALLGLPPESRATPTVPSWREPEAAVREVSR
ncbi:MAG: ELM1/GtrOC1 family putative glycosyltransferase [Pseudomonadales bacterium]